MDWTEISGYYISYKNADSRVKTYSLPDGAQVLGVAPYETELEATRALLTYFQEMKRELAVCVNRTAAKVRELQNGH